MNSLREAAKSSRDVGLDIIPIYVRAGSIVPLGPIKQYTNEKVNEPL